MQFICLLWNTFLFALCTMLSPFKLKEYCIIWLQNICLSLACFTCPRKIMSFYFIYFTLHSSKIAAHCSHHHPHCFHLFVTKMTENFFHNMQLLARLAVWLSILQWFIFTKIVSISQMGKFCKLFQRIGATKSLTPPFKLYINHIQPTIAWFALTKFWPLKCQLLKLFSIARWENEDIIL